MAVSRVLKLQLLAHESIRGPLKRFLREAGVVHVTESEVSGLDTSFDEGKLRDIEQIIEKVQYSITFLSHYTPKVSFLKKLSSQPPVLSRNELLRLIAEVDVDEVFSKVSSIERSMRRKKDELAKSIDLVSSLEPWKSISAPIESLLTESFVVDFWMFPSKRFSDAVSDVSSEYSELAFDVCREEKDRIYVTCISGRDVREKVVEKLKLHGGFRFNFNGLKGTPSEIIKLELEKQDEISKELVKLEDEAGQVASLKDKLLILQDHYSEEKALFELESYLARTETTFLLEGWVREQDARNLEKDLNSRFKEIFISLREPGEDEVPPVALDNREPFRPFEFVTTLYGYPHYREIDPTPLLAPFFVIFFALCLTDAGYGVTLSALSALALIKLKPQGGMEKLLRVLFFGGIVTAVIGVITGGIFGIDINSLPPFLRQFVIINPLEEPMKMLNVSFLFGLVHMLFGMGIRMYSNIRSGRVLDALFDDLAWIIFLIALAPLGFAGILGGEVPEVISTWAKKVSLVVAGVIFLTAGRKQGNIVKKFFKGLISFYDVVGYFGDVLSYARLLALGLATSAIAIAINGIAKMVLGLPFYTGYIAAAIVLVMGHMFNIAVNTLGAFVHSGRLQYLEFFSKFFTGGGKAFRPFKAERRYSVVKEDEV